MKALQQYIDQMNQLLEELVQVATKLREVSMQVISEEELEPLQKRQEELLTQLEEVDRHIQKNGFRIDAASEQHLHQQLHTFQQLNQEGITIVMVTHEPDISQYARRNVVMRDGVVRDDFEVRQRFDAGAELEKVKETGDEAV